MKLDLRVWENCLIENSFIGPYTSVGDEAHVIDSSVEYCVILENALIKGVERLEESFIGRNAKILKNKNQQPQSTPIFVLASTRDFSPIVYANNAFLATKISFINTIANICQKIQGTDITTLAKGIGLDKRINPHFLNAGLGYGGSCFPKDVKALIAFSKSLGYDSILIKAVEDVNNTQPQQAIELAKKHLGNLRNKRIALLGLAFKPNTDDMREARSIPIINQLLKEGANITAYDPVAIHNAKTIFKNKIRYATSAIDCLKNVDCCILITEWNEFKKLTPDTFTRSMRTPILIDGRRIFDPKQFEKELKFVAIGLGQRH